MRAISLNSRRKLKAVDAGRFTDVEPPLFAELAKVVCRAGMLPQKELHECWQMATIVHKAFPKNLHIADLAAGHGLLAWILVLLARTNEVPVLRTAVAVDIKRPKSADALAAVMTEHWPNLTDSVQYVEGSIDAVTVEDGPETLFVAAHACGSLSDRVLMAAITSRSPLAIMPCCHSFRKQGPTLSALARASDLPIHSIDSISVSAASVGQPTAIDQFRIDALTALGYQISEGFIQKEITTFNRIIMGLPSEASDRIPSHDHEKSPKPYVGGTFKRIGEIRAYEKVQSLNVADIQKAQVLSRRPSREWVRTFDLSFWVDDASVGHRLADDLDGLTRQFMACDTHNGIEANITVRDRYTDPGTSQLAFTYRIEIKSSTVIIAKADAILLRSRLCHALSELSPGPPADFALRGN
ncbi:MAG: methyltransferase [Pseudobdellovibrionaceae bacterium]|nr:methyltransferase [Pseudobdellovibrionaceae bacterium]